MSISVGDILHITQVIRVEGVSTVIGMDYKLEDSGTALNDLDLVNSLINDNWNPDFIEGVWEAANTTLVLATCLKVRKIKPLIEDDFVYIQNTPGNIIADHMPAHAAVMITKTARLTTPGNSGRNFFPAPPTTHFSGGYITIAGRVLWEPVASYLNDVISEGAFGTQWAPQHVQKTGSLNGDIMRTWVNPNIRTIRSRQAVECPV